MKLATLDTPGLDVGGVAPSLVANLSRRLVAALRETPGYVRARGAANRELPLLDWGRRFLPHYFTLPPSALHTWLAAELDRARVDRGLRINLIGPRDSAKSTLAATAHALRCALEGTEPLVWLCMETAAQAAKALANIKDEIVENAALAAAYPGVCGRGPIWSASTIQLLNGVRIEAHGRGEKIRGTKNRQSRPTLIITDDLESEPSMYSQAVRQAARDWFSGTVLKAGDSRTTFVNLANALHREALASWLMTRPGWQNRTFSAIVQWPERMDLWEQWQAIYHDVDRADHQELAWEFYAAHREAMEAGAVVLWPERESLYRLMCMRAETSPAVFEREKQGRPVTSDQSEWPESYFGECWFDEWPAGYQARTIALDPSKGKDARRGDYSAFALVQVTEGVVYVDVDMARRPVSEIVSDGVTLYQEFQPQAFGVEANAWQDLLAPMFADELQRRGGLPFEPWEVVNKTKKEVRIRRLGSWLAQHRIRFRRGSPGALLAVAQLRDFPDPHAHDDGPDAIEMAIRLAESVLGGQDHSTET